MLDGDTKSRIDKARNILVGKVPDPKSQVEQITIALIYKFMDDMDDESVNMGGKRSFFTGEYKQYSWANLMDSRLGGHEVLNVYGEAIVKFNQNPALPPLFREIFKNAFLPFRDPETLMMFLRVINDFTYDHSERLGDAFEYLLSVLGSQGDAGQFRTPRNIIDFMVEVIDPQKNESILDPACGTGGFLISSYKHIMNSNMKRVPGDLLGTTERIKLFDNFRGYDISPDMVRLSLVNLYLHHFVQPQISEYDTLTSDDNWNEYADVILANPPFMTPTGGIRPHKRFSVQSNRSEVLFVDYIAEHLTPKGRAAVIVPEGIIFQNVRAYKQLRKMLVEKYLYAVVSLPAGVFNPYSVVKTSILFLEPALAQKSDSILFVKIENDGFSLGAQRRAIDKNDLPGAVELIGEFRKIIVQKISHRGTKDTEEKRGDHEMTSHGGTEARRALGGGILNSLIVSKAKIAEDGAYNLTGERYRVSKRISSKYPLLNFDEVCTLEYGSSLPKSKRITGSYPVVGSNGITGYHNEFLIPGPAIIIGRKGSAGEVTFISQPCYPIDTTYYLKLINHHTTDFHFIYYVLKSMNLPALRGGAGIPGLNRSDVYRSKKIPLPPLEVQQEIVAQIEDYQKIINGAQQVVDNWKPHIDVDPGWLMVKVGDIVDFVSGLTVSIPDVEEDGGIPIISINNVTEQGKLNLVGLRFIKPPKKKLNYVQKGDLLFNWRNGSKHLVGKTAYFDLDGDFLFASFLLGVRPNNLKVNNVYLWYLLNKYRREGKYEQFMRQNVNGLFNREELKDVLIPLPPLEVQQKIVEKIQAEQKAVDHCRELINIYQEKIDRLVEGLWG